MAKYIKPVVLSEMSQEEIANANFQRGQYLYCSLEDKKNKSLSRVIKNSENRKDYISSLWICHNCGDKTRFNYRFKQAVKAVKREIEREKKLVRFN